MHDVLADPSGRRAAVITQACAATTASCYKFKAPSQSHSRPRLAENKVSIVLYFVAWAGASWAGAADTGRGQPQLTAGAFWRPGPVPAKT